jgi:Tfp pilus assembly protein PilN
VSRSTQSNVDIQTINDQLKQKEKLLRDLGWENGINKSALVDQLASLLPEEVTWNNISVDPIDAVSSRTQKSLIFFDRQIRVTGTSEKIIPVNEWIARVKTKPWVKNVQMDSYTFNSELNTGQFTVIINY